MSELCSMTSTSQDELDCWSRLGLFNGRKLRSDYIDLDTAQQAMLMRRLIDSGIRTRLAASLISLTEPGCRQVTARVEGSLVTITADDLEVG